MARPNKQGIDYFPYDIDLDNDDKLGMIIGEFGYKGECFYTKLLGFIYKHNGYFTDWGEDAQLRFLRRYNYCGFSMSFIKEVTPRFIKWGIFNEAVFNTFQILTSSRIQTTWLDAVRKRKERFIDREIWITKVNDAAEAEETKKKAEVTHKVNKSKVNKSEEDHPPKFDLSSSNLYKKPVIPSKDEVLECFIQNGGTSEMADKFWEVNSGTGWYYKSSPIENFRMFVPGYVESWNKNEKEKITVKEFHQKSSAPLRTADQF